MKSDSLALAMGMADAEQTTPQITLAVAGDEDRELIYRARHDVYGLELRQHAANGDGRLSDALDEWNVYLVAKVDGALAGFISITPPHPNPLPERERFSRRKGSAGDSIEKGERDRPGRSSRRPADWFTALADKTNWYATRAAKCFRRDAENCGRDARAPLSSTESFPHRERLV